MTRAAVADHFLASADVKLLRSALKAAEKGQWSTFRSREARLGNTLVKKFLLWRRLVAKGVTPGFQETDQFRVANPGWPLINRLIRRAEQAIPRSWSHEDVIVWFGHREPLSALGASRLGEAERSLGLIDEGTERIRKAWINGDFNRSQFKAFYKQFRAILTSKDHQKRLNRLLWDGRHKAARQLWSLVNKDWQKLAQARIALRRREGNVDTLIKQVPKALQNHPGLVYERLRWRRKKNLETAIDLANSLGPPMSHTKKWWKERAILARRALRKGKITDAYKIASANGLSPGGAAHAEAEWLSGWIALRFLGNHKAAFFHFERMHSSVKFPISLARGAYWAGRAIEAASGEEAASHWYRKASKHNLTYYGQLAFAQLNSGKTASFPDVIKLPAIPSEEFDNHELVRLIRILGDLREDTWVKIFIKSLTQVSEDPDWWARIVHLAAMVSRPDLSILVGKKALQMGKPLFQGTFPILTPPKILKIVKSRRPEVPLVLAVIRQESAFRIIAKSRAGALGLMQLMPATARTISRRLKLPYSRSRLKSSPQYNITLGQTYLGDLIEKFQGSYVLALASYNAGPHRVRRWIRSYGDLRDKDVDSIDWVEMIPISETRDYVQRVLESLQVYRYLISDKKAYLD